MILLKSIKLLNFLSHENTFIEFKENQKSIITGASGVGKSTILDAITWCLYGEGRSDNRSLVKKNAERAEVSLKLVRNVAVRSADENEIFIVSRHATVAGKHVLEVVRELPSGERESIPETGIRAVQDWINKELIGASYALFANSVAYIQGGSNSFVTQTAPRRKELLLEIIGAEGFDKYYEGARKSLQEAEKKQEGINGQLLELNASQAALLARITLPEDQEKIILASTVDLAELDAKKKLLEADKATFAAFKTSLTMVEKSIEIAENESMTANGSIVLKKKKIANKSALEAKLFNEEIIKTTIATLNQKLESKNIEFIAAIESSKKRETINAKKPFDYSTDRLIMIEGSKKQIEALKQKPVCPAGENCPYGGNTTKLIAEREEEIAKFEKENIEYCESFKRWEVEIAGCPVLGDKDKILGEIREMEKEVNEQKNSLVHIEFAKKELESLGNIESEIVELEKGLEEKGKQIEELRNQKTKIIATIDPERVKTVENELIQTEEKIIIANSLLTRATLTLENIAKDKKQYEEGVVRKETLDKEIKSIKENVRKLQLVKDAFGSKGGVQAIVVDYVLPRLEEKVNDILGKLSDFKVRLDTQKTTTDGEGVVEGLWITIVNEVGQEMDFNNYSGGEKVRISIAIAEALASLSKKIGFRLIDEAIMALSPEMTEQFVSVLGEILGKYNQVFCVSHLPEVQETFESRINVRKHNGSSLID